MTNAIAQKTPVTIQPDDEYPSSDGKPMAETEVHILALLHLIDVLRFYFRKQTDVYVIGNMFLYYREGDAGARKAPDIMVVKGVDATIRRRSYKLWEEGVVPSVVFELTSRKTQSDDVVAKPVLYASLGIREYILFDPLHDYLTEQLMGYRMDESGEYVRIPLNEDGDLYSEELGLTLRADDAILRVVDPWTEEIIPALAEAADLAQHHYQRAEQESQRAEQAESEVERLRALLKSMGHDPE